MQGENKNGFLCLTASYIILSEHDNSPTLSTFISTYVHFCLGPHLSLESSSLLVYDTFFSDLALTPILEGFVMLKKNPDYEEEIV